MLKNNFLDITAHTTQNVALTGRNRTGPPCSVGRPTAQMPGPNGHPRVRPARQPAALQTTTDDDKRRRSLLVWPRRASNNTEYVLHMDGMSFPYYEELDSLSPTRRENNTSTKFSVCCTNFF